MFFTISANVRSLDQVEIPARTKILKVNPKGIQVRPFDSLRGLEQCPDLEVLVIRTRILDLDGIQCCTKLRKLVLWDSEIDTLEPLRGLKQLRHLELDGDQVIDSIDVLSELKLLVFLSLTQFNLKSIEPIRNLRKLRILDLSNNKIKDLEPLRSLSYLRSLNCYYNKITSLEPLSGLHNLSHLDLQDNYIKSLRGIENLYRLKTLSIPSNDYEREELIWIPSSVKRLYTDFTPLENPQAELDEIRDLKAKRLHQIFYKFYIVKIQRLWMYKFWHEEDSSGYTRACRYYCNKNVEYDRELKAKTRS